jgi:hypothetical protein
VIFIPGIERYAPEELADFVDYSGVCGYDVADMQKFIIAGGGKMPTGRIDLFFVWDNAMILRHRGIYERLLLKSYVGAKGNWSHWNTSTIATLFRLADREKLRAAGEPLPGDGPFTVYRGVAGIGRRRRLKGFSWTDDYDRACWFAQRPQYPMGPLLPNPAVLKATVAADEVLAYTNHREEREFICQPKEFERIRIKHRSAAETTELVA